jgi:hypothetical protein
MKLTKLHVFLILLVALTLCYTLGMCYKEGFESSSKTPDNFIRHPQGETYRDGYSDYYANEDDANVSATNKSKGLPDSYRNKYYNPNDRAHGGSDRRYNDNNNNNNNDNTYDNDEMNGGDENDPSDMITSSFKHTKYNKAYNASSRREKTNNNGYDSVSQGAMNGSMYSNSDPSQSPSDDSSNGITRDQIPNGQEDMYILKSQVIAPVCPACPAFPPINCDKLTNGGKKCPPCPSCARCPEPAFECKKVPNYGSSSLMGQLPLPWADKL